MKTVLRGLLPALLLAACAAEEPQPYPPGAYAYGYDPYFWAWYYEPFWWPYGWYCGTCGGYYVYQAPPHGPGWPHPPWRGNPLPWPNGGTVASNKSPAPGWHPPAAPSSAPVSTVAPRAPARAPVRSRWPGR